MTEEQGKRIIANYVSIVAPVACLGSEGLAKFYSQVSWPWDVAWLGVGCG